MIAHLLITAAPRPIGQSSLVAVAHIGLSLCGVTGLLASAGCSAERSRAGIVSSATAQKTASSGDDSVRATILRPSRRELDLGTIPRGGRGRTEFCLENESPVAVEVVDLRTSCDCFRVSLNRDTIGPGDKVVGAAEVDFSNDPDFAGLLVMNAQARVKGSGEPAFAITVRVRVQGDPPADR
jgi:hypothetical protein